MQVMKCVCLFGLVGQLFVVVVEQFFFGYVEVLFEGWVVVFIGVGGIFEEDGIRDGVEQCVEFGVFVLYVQQFGVVLVQLLVLYLQYVQYQVYGQCVDEVECIQLEYGVVQIDFDDGGLCLCWWCQQQCWYCERVVYVDL